MDMDMNVLLVDDFSTMRRILKKALKVIGFNNFIEAEDGKDAIEKLKKDDVDLIFCDWNMPNMTGLDFLKYVRSKDKLKDIPFIMVTAEGQKANVIEAVDAGVSNYIIKPFTADTVKEKLNKVFK
ncbi:MAG: response regulator [Desulfobacteraceae bacterium]|jgi:two-component system chemotaxis response regulator CheY